MQTPPLFEATAWVGYGIAIAAVAFACVRSVGLKQSPSGSLLFAAWAVTVSLLARSVPKWWAAGARYTVTQRSVIWQRGPFRRTLDRAAISYARITWSEHAAHVGNLELIRAVPTGVLWRRLALRLEGLESPDGVFAIIRGAQGVVDACPYADGCPSCIGAPDAPPAPAGAVPGPAAGAEAVVIQASMVNAKQSVRAFLSAWAAALEG